MYRKSGIGCTVEAAFENMKSKHNKHEVEEFVELIVPDNMSAGTLEQRLFIAAVAIDCERDLTATEMQCLTWFRNYYCFYADEYINTFKFSPLSCIAIRDKNCYRFVSLTPHK